MDNIAMFIVSIGNDVKKEVQILKDKGEFLKSHILSALTLELAEGYAEYLHQKIRNSWGITDDPNMTLMDLFQSKYQGNRYSFGYPACPNIEDQKTIFQLLDPNSELNVKLTENFMMDPEASVSALVFHH